ELDFFDQTAQAFLRRYPPAQRWVQRCFDEGVDPELHGLAPSLQDVELQLRGAVILPAAGRWVEARSARRPAASAGARGLRLRCSQSVWVVRSVSGSPLVSL